MNLKNLGLPYLALMFFTGVGLTIASTFAMFEGNRLLGLCGIVLFSAMTAFSSQTLAFRRIQKSTH
jgi:FtsH-binding integral membrane protein